MSNLKAAFDRTDYRMLEQTPTLSLPVATPAILETSRAFPGTADRIQNRLERDGFVFISPYCEDGPDGGVYVSSKVCDEESGENFHVKLCKERVSIFPDDENLSYETFERFVDHVESRLGVRPEPEERGSCP